MSAPDERSRVAVTGIGVICGLGTGRDEVWQAAAAGRSGARPISRFDPSGHAVTNACEVPDYDPARFVDSKTARRADMASIVAVGAARMAFEDANIDPRDLDPVQTGAIISSATGGSALRERQHIVARTRGVDRLSPFTVPHTIANTPSAMVSMEFDLRGPLFSASNACAASTDAIGLATDIIRRGDADLMLAGGSECVITPFWVAAFDAMRVLSHRNDDPAGAIRPFDADRDGFLIGEGSAVLVLERLEAARERGATVICEIAGYGASADAHHIADPEPSGAPQSWAMEAAITDAGLSATDIDYFNAHGGASQPGDPTEIAALRLALGEHAAAVGVSGTKSMHGHCMGATGAIEASITAMAIQHQVMPPTASLSRIDAACEGVDHVTGSGRAAPIGAALTANYGLGGHNSALCLTESAPQ